MNYVGKLNTMDLVDYRLMARYLGHMLLMATEYMNEGSLTNMMMNQLDPFFVACCLDNAGVEYFDAPLYAPTS